jgi:hypothetical protein
LDDLAFVSFEVEFSGAHSVGDKENPEKKSASQSAVTPSS